MKKKRKKDELKIGVPDDKPKKAINLEPLFKIVKTGIRQINSSSSY